jgi:osmotically inducible lipoprotein OsmB
VAKYFNYGADSTRALPWRAYSVEQLQIGDVCQVIKFYGVMSMTTNQKFTVSMVALLIIFGVGVGGSACSEMSTQDKNTAVGAGVGGVAGSILTGGSTAGTVGGAAVGGIIGHEVDKPKK